MELYERLLYTHIRKEDECLFVMAERGLGEKSLDRLEELSQKKQFASPESVSVCYSDLKGLCQKYLL